MNLYMKYQRPEEQARKARNAYAREWRAKNRDKVRQYNMAYWLKKAQDKGDQGKGAILMENQTGKGED